ncbi:hypothetical protein AV540_13125 [Brevibacillus parabrevis]|nr:hypothetical protein AV540_13125 [Brevibacillus parabrevis]
MRNCFRAPGLLRGSMDWSAYGKKGKAVCLFLLQLGGSPKVLPLVFSVSSTNVSLIRYGVPERVLVNHTLEDDSENRG